jgi:hypothetical protein
MIGHSSPSRQVYVFGIILTISVYYGTMYFFSYNMPYNDDYEAILGFMNQYVDAKDMMSRLQLIFSQHHEHRIGLTHIITLLQYKITGSVSFVIINTIGNMALLVIYFIFLKMIQQPGASNSISDHGLLSMVTSFLLFNFSFFILTTWAMASTAQLWCFAFSVMLCHFITKTDGFYIALIAGLGAVICQGNGLFVLIVGLWYLMCDKQWLRAAIFVIFTLLLFYLYFSGYNWTADNEPAVQSPRNFLSIGAYFLTFIGSLFSVSHSQLHLPEVLIAFPMSIGTIMFSIFIYLTITEKKVFRPDAIHLFMAFLMITSAAAAFSRSNMGIAQAMAVRYKIVSTLILICIVYLLYDYWVRGKYGKKIKKILCIGGILLWTGSLIYTYPLYLHLRALQQPITSDDTNQYVQFHHGRSFATAILREAEDKKIFKSPVDYQR